MEIIVFIFIAGALIYLYLEEEKRKERQKWAEWEEEQERQRLQIEREKQEAEPLRQRKIDEEKERVRQQQADQERRVQQAKTAEREREIAQKAKQEEEAHNRRLAEEERQRKERIQAIEKARKALEEDESSKPVSLAPKKEEVLIERDTAYAERVLNIHNPCFINFREVAKSTTFQWETDYRDQLWRRLQNGVAILTDEDELTYYFFSYGQMHQAKLNDAFSRCIHSNMFSANNSTINIIDYGCGQALASVCLMDYIQARGISNFKITRITLIEPSQKALMRGALHSKCVTQHLNTSPTLLTIKKLMDEVSHEDLSTESTSVKIHLFSNILDVTTFDLLSLAKKIGSTQKGENYFICVSPTYGQVREARMNAFFEYFHNHNRATLISERFDDVETSTGPKKRQEKIFKVQFN